MRYYIVTKNNTIVHAFVAQLVRATVLSTVCHRFKPGQKYMLL